MLLSQVKQQAYKSKHLASADFLLLLAGSLLAEALKQGGKQ
jgi:hypothetical protein